MLVFLFGSYDSRGGTTAVVAPDRDTAYATYSQAIFLGELGLDDKAQREILDAEYLGPAELDGDLPEGVEGVEGVDLDWDTGAVFCRITDHQPAGVEHDERPQWVDDEVLELRYGADPCRDTDEMPIAPPGYWHPRWDDAYGFVLMHSS